MTTTTCNSSSRNPLFVIEGHIDYIIATTVWCLMLMDCMIELRYFGKVNALKMQTEIALLKCLGFL